MKPGYIVVLLAVCAGCLDEPEAQVEQDLERPALSSICSSACNNSHGQHVCDDQRFSGQVNVSVFPLIEGTTKVASSTLGTTSGWASTSCPSCEWQLVSVTQQFLFGGTAPNQGSATNDFNASKNLTANHSYEWDGTVTISIFDPTDASVGTCTLDVPVTLIGGNQN